MTTREDWRTLPELRIDHPMPEHIERGLQRRYAHPSTVNHTIWHDEHVSYLATGAAPGPRIRHRRYTWLGMALAWVLKSIPAAVVIGGALLLVRGLLGGL